MIKRRMAVVAGVAAAGVALTGTAASAAPHGPRVVKTLKVADGPYETAVNPYTGTVYLASADYDNNTSSLTVIDGRTDRVRRTVKLDYLAFGVAVNRRTGKVYTTNTIDKSVSVFSRGGDLIKKIDGAGSVHGLGVDPGTDTIYAAAPQDGKVVAIDGHSDKVTATFDAGTTPTKVGVNELTHKLYVTGSYQSNAVTVVDGRTHKVTKTIGVGTWPLAAAVDSLRGTVYVDNYKDDTVSVISERTGKVVRTVKVGKEPIGADVDPVTGRAYVTNSGDGTVSVIGRQGVTSVTTGDFPLGVAVNPLIRKVYVGNKAANTVTVLK